MGHVPEGGPHDGVYYRPKGCEIVMAVSSPVLNFSNMFTYYERGRSAERVVLKLTYWKLIGLSDWIELVKVLACNFNM